MRGKTGKTLCLMLVNSEVEMFLESKFQCIMKIDFLMTNFAAQMKAVAIRLPKKYMNKVSKYNSEHRRL